MVIPCPNPNCRSLVRVPTGDQVKVTCPRCKMRFNFGPVLIGACPSCGAMEFEQKQGPSGAAQDVCRACRWPESPAGPPRERASAPSTPPPPRGGFVPAVSLGLVGLAIALAAFALFSGEGSAARVALVFLVGVGPLAVWALACTQWGAARPAEAQPMAAEAEEVEIVEPDQATPAPAETPRAGLSEDEAAARRRFLDLLRQEDFLTPLAPLDFATFVTELFRLDGAEVLKPPAQAGLAWDAVLRDYDGKFVVRCLPATEPVGRETLRSFAREVSRHDVRGYLATIGEVSPDATSWTELKDITVMDRGGILRLAGEVFSETYVFGPDFTPPIVLPEPAPEAPAQAADGMPKPAQGEPGRVADPTPGPAVPALG
jgi:hypothetical protein